MIVLFYVFIHRMLQQQLKYLLVQQQKKSHKIICLISSYPRFHHVVFFSGVCILRGPGSLVGIATGYGLDGLGTEFR